jgi:hypothetical protein
MNHAASWAGGTRVQRAAEWQLSGRGSVAAHYVARLEPDSHEAPRWHLLALEYAHRDGRCSEFMGWLFVSLGGAYEATGDAAMAEHFFELAAQQGVRHVAG